MNRIISLLVLPFIAVACAAPAANDAETSSESGLTATWKPIVSCDGGAMTIEIDAQQKALHVVVHDENIARWVSQYSYDSTYKGNHCGADPTMAANPCLDDKGDLVLPGSTDAFSPSGFHWMRGSAQLFDGERIVDFTAWRDGAGIRLERMSDSTTHWSCDYTGSGFCAPPTSDPAPKQVYADWMFRSCVNL